MRCAQLCYASEHNKTWPSPLRVNYLDELVNSCMALMRNKDYSGGFYSILSRVSTLARDSDIVNSVCLFICPSVRYVLIFYGNGLTYYHNFATAR